MYQVSHQFYAGAHSNAPTVQTPAVAPGADVGPVAPAAPVAGDEGEEDAAAPAETPAVAGEEDAAAPVETPALIQRRFRKNFLRKGRTVMLNQYP